MRPECRHLVVFHKVPAFNHVKGIGSHVTLHKLRGISSDSVQSVLFALP